MDSESTVNVAEPKASEAITVCFYPTHFQIQEVVVKCFESVIFFNVVVVVVVVVVQYLQTNIFFQ